MTAASVKEILITESTARRKEKNIVIGDLLIVAPPK
jgi:hypothetical protein